MSARASPRRRRWREEEFLLLFPILCGLATALLGIFIALSLPTVVLPAATRAAFNLTQNPRPTDTFTPTPSSTFTPTPSRTSTPTPTITRVTPSVAGALDGFVYNSFKQTLPKVQVDLTLDQRTITNSDGFYSFRNLLSGNYQMTVIATGYETTTLTVFVPAGQTQHQNFFLIRTPIKPLATVTLNGNDCFSFESGVISQAQNVAFPVAVILRCPANADIWWQPSNSLGAVNNNAIDYSKGKSFEDCPVTQSNLIKVAQPGDIYCASTVQRHTAVLFVSRVNFSDHLITFDWLLY